MTDIILKQKEMINRINCNLSVIKSHLIGKEDNDTCCEKAEERCLLDTAKRNLNDLEYAMYLVETIRDTIMGGNEKTCLK